MELKVEDLTFELDRKVHYRLLGTGKTYQLPIHSSESGYSLIRNHSPTLLYSRHSTPEPKLGLRFENGNRNGHGAYSAISNDEIRTKEINHVTTTRHDIATSSGSNTKSNGNGLDNGGGTDRSFKIFATTASHSTEGVTENDKLGQAIQQLRAESEMMLLQVRDEQETREIELGKQISSLAGSFQKQAAEFSSLHWKLSALERNVASHQQQQQQSGISGSMIISSEESNSNKAHSSLEGAKSVEQEGFTFSTESEQRRLEGLVQKMEAEKQEMLSKYQYLLEAKTSLDSEISIYRTLLEDEEDRYVQ